MHILTTLYMMFFPPRVCCLAAWSLLGRISQSNGNLISHLTGHLLLPGAIIVKTIPCNSLIPFLPESNFNILSYVPAWVACLIFLEIMSNKLCFQFIDRLSSPKFRHTLQSLLLKSASLKGGNECKIL